MAGKFNLTGIADTPVDKPEAVANPTEREIEAANLAARKTGFVSRDPEPVLLRSGGREDAVRQLSIRLPLSYANRLVKYCEENRYSYPALIMKLMDEKGI